MEETWKLLASIAGSAIVILLAVLGFGGRKLLTDFIADFKELRADVKDIKSEISELRTENQLTKSYIHEIEGRFEMRLQGHESQFRDHKDELKDLKHRVLNIERFRDSVKIHHARNHPDDKIE